MSKIAKILLCALLVAALAVPAFAKSTCARRTTSSKVTRAIYRGSATALERTEGLLTGCLRRTFSLFNPCLDFAKGAATIAFMPIEKPLDYIERAAFKPYRTRRAAPRIPEPKKPEIPKK